MTTTPAKNVDERLKTFLAAERPRGFPLLHRQNQVAIIKLINDPMLILEFQEKGWPGVIKLELAAGGLITQIKPTPTFDVKFIE